MSKDFFQRKTIVKKELEIPEPGEYDLQNFDDDTIACGIDSDSMSKRHFDLFKNLIVDSSQENPVATICSKLEETFSKRELSFLLAKDILLEAWKEQEKIMKNKEK